MSISLEITRIQAARNKIRAKLVELGLVTSTANIDNLATAVDTISDNGNISAKVKEGQTYTIPKGYHRGSGTVTGIAGGGSYTLQSKTATPTKSEQAITPDDGFYGLSDVTVAAIPDAYQDVSAVTAVAADVLSPKVIVNKLGQVIAGTMPDNGSASKTIDAMTASSVSIPAGYTSGGTVSITDSVEAALAAI